MYRTHSGYLTRYHWWKANFDINSGDIMTFTHHKSHSDTALRLTASGNHVTRESTVSPGASVRWFVLVVIIFMKHDSLICYWNKLTISFTKYRCQ